jgi:hypothetical protein
MMSILKTLLAARTSAMTHQIQRISRAAKLRF